MLLSSVLMLFLEGLFTSMLPQSSAHICTYNHTTQLGGRTLSCSWTWGQGAGGWDCVKIRLPRLGTHVCHSLSLHLSFLICR